MTNQPNPAFGNMQWSIPTHASHQVPKYKCYICNKDFDLPTLKIHFMSVHTRIENKPIPPIRLPNVRPRGIQPQIQVRPPLPMQSWSNLPSFRPPGMNISPPMNRFNSYRMPMMNNYVTQFPRMNANFVPRTPISPPMTSTFQAPIVQNQLPSQSTLNTKITTPMTTFQAPPIVQNQLPSHSTLNTKIVWEWQTSSLVFNPDQQQQQQHQQQQQQQNSIQTFSTPISPPLSSPEDVETPIPIQEIKNEIKAEFDLDDIDVENLENDDNGLTEIREILAMENLKLKVLGKNENLGEVEIIDRSIKYIRTLAEKSGIEIPETEENINPPASVNQEDLNEY